MIVTEGRRARQIFQCAGTFYLWFTRVPGCGWAYVSKFATFMELRIFGTAPAHLQPFWAQQLGMQFGFEGDRSLRSLEGLCSSCKQHNANLSFKSRTENRNQLCRMPS